MHKSENDTKCKETGKKLMLSYKINTIKCTLTVYHFMARNAVFG